MLIDVNQEEWKPTSDVLFQMAIITIMIVPEFFESDLIYEDLNSLTQLSKKPKYLQSDIERIREVKICSLIQPQVEEEPTNSNSATNLIMHSELLSGGL